MAEIDLANELADYGKEGPPGQQTTFRAGLRYPNEPVQINTGLLSWGDYPPQEYRCAQCRRFMPEWNGADLLQPEKLLCIECQRMRHGPS
jgi:hypothetical protein